MRFEPRPPDSAIARYILRNNRARVVERHGPWVILALAFGAALAVVIYLKWRILG